MKGNSVDFQPCAGPSVLQQSALALFQVYILTQHRLLFVQQMKGNSVKFQPGAGPSVPQQCPHTGAGFLMGGPFWVEPLHDPTWISAVLASVKVGAVSLSLLGHSNLELPDWSLAQGTG